jgi:hypothetical protein
MTDERHRSEPRFCLKNGIDIIWGEAIEDDFIVGEANPINDAEEC